MLKITKILFVTHAALAFYLPCIAAMENGPRELIVKENSRISSETLPSTLNKLAHLEKLTVHNRRIEDECARAINGLSHLQELNLLDCYVPVMPDTLTELKKLNLGDSRVKRETLETLENLPFLQELSLWGIHIKKLPSFIAHLSQLTKLNVVKCSLKTLPIEMKSLTQLTDLNLGINNFNDKALLALTALPQLQTLHLHMNKLSSLPSEMSTLTSLKVLDLAHNSLSSNAIAKLPHLFPQLESLDLSMQAKEWGAEEGFNKLPAEMNTFHCLRELDISFNDKFSLDSVAAVCAKLPSLIKLNLESMSIRDLPQAFEELTQLQKLNIGCCSNKLSVAALKTISKLNNLRCLRINRVLSRDNIEGLPHEMVNLQQLQQLDLGGNSITSGDCKIIAQLHALQELRLFASKLFTLPRAMSNLRQLQKLDAGCNHLNLKALKIIATLAALRDLNLEKNELTELPTEMENLQQLQKLNVRSNDLCQTALVIIARLRSLLDLNLGINGLEGLPENFGSLHNLQKINLDGSKMSAEGLDVILQLAKLRRLSCSFIEGAELPRALFKASQLEKIDITHVDISTSMVTQLMDSLPHTEILYSQRLHF